MEKLNLKDLSFQKLEDFVVHQAWPRFRAEQLIDWIYQKGILQFSEMTNISMPCRQYLTEHCRISSIQQKNKEQSEDGTEKYLLTLEDLSQVEAILIPEKGPSRTRLTLCVSTQVGCTLDCTFCRTGQMGLLRNLKAHEIVEQILTVQRSLGTFQGGPRISNLVMMGMGEPLANFNEVVEAIRRITHPQGIGLAPHRITLSTAGLVPQIKKLGALELGVKLAISLNAATDTTRNELMGTINRKYPLKDLIESCRQFPLSSRARLTFEYVLIQSVNDSLADARQLRKLLKGIRCKINLIPYNPHPSSPYRSPSEEMVLSFQSVLQRSGFDVFVRKSKGKDILAACGQLLTAPPLDTTSNQLIG